MATTSSRDHEREIDGAPRGDHGQDPHTRGDEHGSGREPSSATKAPHGTESHDHAEHAHTHDPDHASGHTHSHDDDPDSGHHHQHENGPFGFLTGIFSPHSHDTSDSIDDALAGSNEGIKAVKFSLLGLGITAALQLVIVVISSSVALLADTIHNFADASTAIPLWIAFSLGRRRENRRYTYGYGRAEDLAGVFVVLMITASAALAAYESIDKLLNPEPIRHLIWVAAAAVIGCIGNEWVAQYRIRTGERIGSAALIADGYHARTDGLTSLAVLLGAGGVWLGFPQADPIVGLLITVAILFILRSAAVRIWHRLMDAVDPAIVEKAEAAARGTKGVESVTAVRARWIGHSVHAEAVITANRDLPLHRAHEIAERVRHTMLHAVPKLASVTVHVDPCRHDGDDPHRALAHHDRPDGRTATS